MKRLLPGVLPLSHAQRSAAVNASSIPALQLPFWGDGASFDQPEYYETIQAGRRIEVNKTVQSADIDGDGQDELIARSPTGIIAHHFDPATGQWIALANGPGLSDLEGWDNAVYYQTIQTADVDGDGKAELLARGAGGIVAWRYDADASSPTYQQWLSLPDGPAWSDGAGWNQPQYYQTIQCADIDGDGRAELLARSGVGIEVWKFTGASWFQMPEGPGWADSGGWNQPQYYQPIQCADIDGDGRAELLARGGGGIAAYQFDPASQSWNELLGGSGGPPWSDANGWLLAGYYATIQCADIDGDGRAEVIGRDGGGIEVWKFTGPAWVQMPRGPALSDGSGWGLPPYVFTIQCADINGDGKAEILARSGTGIVAYVFDVSGQSWQALPSGPGWADQAGATADNPATSWDEVQYYGTIQTARVKGNAANPHNPGGASGSAYAALIGRGFFCLQTWRFDAAHSQWNRISASFPTFTGRQLTVYQYLNQSLFGIAPALDIRAQYATLTSASVADWQDNLSNDNPASLPPPPGMTKSDPDWLAVRAQLFNELLLVGNVLSIRDLTNTQLLIDVTIDGGSNGLLTTVDNALKASLPAPPSGGSSGVFATLIQIIANAAWALSALAAPEVAVPLAVTTGLLASGSIGLSLLPNPNESYTYSDGELDQLREGLHEGFVSAVTANGIAAQAYVQDWGLLQVMGRDISFDGAATAAVSRSYETFAYQKLSPVYWAIAGLSFDNLLPIAESGYDGSEPFLHLTGSSYYAPGSGNTLYIGVVGDETGTQWDQRGSDIAYDVSIPVDTQSNAFSRLFGPISPVSPQLGGLGVPFGDVIEGRGEWELPNGLIYEGLIPGSFDGFGDDSSDPGGNGPLPPFPQPRTPRVKLRKGTFVSVGATLTRDANSGALAAAVTIKNKGTRKLTNVALGQVSLGGHSASVSGGGTRLAPGRSETLWLHFPASAGAAGKTAVLQIKGKYKGGTFGASFRVRLP